MEAKVLKSGDQTTAILTEPRSRSLRLRRTTKLAVRSNPRSRLAFAPDCAEVGDAAWTFDDGFSAYLSQGLDTNKDGKLSREELAGLAKENVEPLVEANYYIVANASGKAVEVAAPDYWMESRGKLLTLHFTIALRAPPHLRARCP